MLPVLSRTMNNFAEAPEEGLNICKEALGGTIDLARSVQSSFFARLPRLPQIRTSGGQVRPDQHDHVSGDEDRVGEHTRSHESEVTLPPPHLIGTSTTAFLHPTLRWQASDQRHELPSRPRQPRRRIVTMPQASGRTVVPGPQQQRHSALVVSRGVTPTSRPNHSLITPFLAKSYEILEGKHISIAACETTTANYGSTIDHRMPESGSALSQFQLPDNSEPVTLHCASPEAYALSGHNPADVVPRSQPDSRWNQPTRPVRLYCDFGNTFSHVHNNIGCRCEVLGGLTQDDGSLLQSHTALVGQPGVGYVRCTASSTL